jgi:hypothetical protein
VVGDDAQRASLRLPKLVQDEPREEYVSYTEAAPCDTIISRSSPMPVSTLGRGSGTRLPSSSRRYRMVTWFYSSSQRSRPRSDN